MIFFKNMEYVVSVSYTHLDVYKRQHQLGFHQGHYLRHQPGGSAQRKRKSISFFNGWNKNLEG